MKTALIISGILAALALLFPSLVTIGFFLFVIPGLILALAPTVFVYLVATMAIQVALPMSPGHARNVVAFGISLMIGWAIMQPIHARGKSTFQAKLQPDVDADEPIELDGRVRIERYRRLREDVGQCDYLCATLLDMPNVEDVSVVAEGEEEAFELVSADEHPAPGLFPHDPAHLLWELRYNKVKKFSKDQQTANDLIEARWALRLAKDERLVSREPVSAENADWVLRLTSERQNRKSDIQRVEIVDANGTVRYRKSQVRHAVPARMFYVGFQMRGGDYISDQWFEVGRQTLRSGKLDAYELEPTLLAALDLPSPVGGDKLLAQLFDEVVKALDDPKASAARLGLANRWLLLFHHDAKETDLPLIERIVLDDRVRDVADALEKVFRKGHVPVTLQEAYARRILMEHTTRKDRTKLARELASMPPWTFSKPHAAHRAIWENANLRIDAAPFLARMADLDPAEATPALLEAFDEAIRITPWRDRRPVAEGIRAGFLRLGPAAAPAAPRVKEVFLQRPSPITNSARDAYEWRFTLVRMNVSVEHLFYPGQSQEVRERETIKIRQRLQREQDERSREVVTTRPR